MPTVQDVLTVKGDHGDQVLRISPDATVLDAVQSMNQHKVGALLVMHGDRVLGIFTERDVLRRVLGDQRQPNAVHVSEVMTTDVICVPPNTDLDEVGAIMKERRIRHLPVCDADGTLHGMISIGDVNAYHVSNQEMTITFLNEYIYGRA